MAYYRKYPRELRDRALRRVAETQQPVSHIAREMGIHPETLRIWVRADEIERGERPELLRDPGDGELQRLRAENAELRRANTILKAATAYFAGELHHTSGSDHALSAPA